jgi:mycothiol system anti-sigma-R factor
MEKPTSKGNCEKLQDCIELVNLILDNEASENEEKFIREHLGECSCCLKQFEIEKEFRTLIKSRMQQKEVPQGLIASIRSKIG